MDEVCGDREQQATNDRQWSSEMWTEILQVRYACDLACYQELKTVYGLNVRAPYPFQ